MLSSPGPGPTITNDHINTLQQLLHVPTVIILCLQGNVVISHFRRRRVEFGMVDFPTSDLSDEDLSSMIGEFRQDNPDVGESMAAGLLRAWGYRVTRARIRNALRNNDPQRAALRWPGGFARRRVYSVAGPNSLWNIGKLNP